MLTMEMVGEQVVLVDALDNEIGLMEKLEAHQKGLLHRAFSVFLFTSSGELVLQRRAWSKYHSGGLWTNTCCSHPRPGEDNLHAASRRLKEEMGIECKLQYAFPFLYRQAVDTLIEHELDHVFIGTYDGEPVLDHLEVAEWKTISPTQLTKEIAANPEDFTVWFRLCLGPVMDYMVGDRLAPDGPITYIS